MPIDWTRLRPWNGSIENGFEELCCQLAAGEPYPTGSRFVRKGTPDAGVECFWTLPEGQEHCWQAKFFTSPPSAGQWGQIDKSVRKVIQKHNKLTRYTICLPINRSDKREKGQKSFLDKWNQRVAVWKKWAARRRIKVEFDYWGDHELVARLAREANRGRHWFWFHQEQLTLAWFREKLDIAIENAGPRYTPQVHVNLPVARFFSALGRTPQFYEALATRYQKLRDSAGWFPGGTLPEDVASVVQEIPTTLETLYTHLDTILAVLHEPAVAGPPEQIPCDTLGGLARAVQEKLNRASDLLWGHILERDRERSAHDQHKSTEAARKLESAQYYCRRFRDAAYRLAEFCESPEARLANQPALLLVGDAGQGKTHLLCDVADKDLKDGRPRIFLHGLRPALLTCSGLAVFDNLARRSGLGNGPERSDTDVAVQRL